MSAVAAGAGTAESSDAAPEWLASFQQDFAFFDSMLDVIPAKYYIRDEVAEAAHWNNKYHRNKKGKAPRQAIKENTKKAKRAKFDLSNPHTTTQKRKEMAQSEAVAGGAAAVGAQPKTKPAQSIAELKERLHARIAELRKKRNATDQDAGGTKQRDGKAKRRRKEEREERKAKGTTNRARGAAFGASTHKSSAGRPATAPSSKGAAAAVPVAIDYGVVRLGSATPELQKKGKSLQSLFAKAKAKQERLQQLSQAERREAKLEAAWDAAAQRVTGKKVKDNPKLLAKALKRREAKKRKSQKAWAERKAAVDRSQKERVSRRESNLKNRGARKQRPGFEGKRKKFLNSGSK